MGANEEYIKFNDHLNLIFAETVGSHSQENIEFDKILADFYEINKVYRNFDASEVMYEVQMDLIISNYLATKGIYRTAYATLRSALELGMLFVYFIDNNYDYLAWKNNKKDISWSKLFGDNGYINSEFFLLFYESKEDVFKKLTEDVVASYRKCSEYTHGKYDFMMSKIGENKFSYNKKQFEEFFSEFKRVTDVIYMLQAIRFRKDITKAQTQNDHEVEDLIDTYNDRFKKYRLEGIVSE